MIAGNIFQETKVFKTNKNQIIFQCANLEEMYKGSRDKLMKEASEFKQKETGWPLELKIISR